MTDKRTAQLILTASDAARLATKDVASIVGVNQVTLRSWLNRGYVHLRNVERGNQGRGKSTFFSPVDVIELMACAQMVTMTMSPGFMGDAAEEVSASVIGQLHLIAETPGYIEDVKKNIAPYRAKRLSELEARGAPASVIERMQESHRKSDKEPVESRYLAIFYSPITNDFLSLPFESEIGSTGGLFSNSVFLVFDCLDLALKTISGVKPFLRA